MKISTLGRFWELYTEELTTAWQVKDGDSTGQERNRKFGGESEEYACFT